MDVRPPGLLFAAIRHCPMLGGSAGAVDVAPALAAARRRARRPARLRTPARPTALAVVGQDRLACAARRRRARGRVAAAAGGRPRQRRDPRRPRASAPATADANDGGFAFYSPRRRARGRRRRPARATVTQVYRAPYLAHAAMEPINCTARVADGKVEVWVPTQVPGLARAIAAQVAGVRRGRRHRPRHLSRRRLRPPPRRRLRRPGGAHRRSRCGGRPVQLVWSREEDLGHDFYRPGRRGGAARHASARTAGRSRCAITSAGDAITPRWIERGLPQPRRPGRHARQDHERRPVRPGLRRCRNQRIAHVATQSGVPVGYWRSVGHSHNAFFSESFIDELAARRAAGPGRLPAGAARRTRRATRRAAARGRSRPAGRATARRSRSRRAGRAASPCTRASAASSPRWSRRRSSTAGRACTGSSAPPTSAPSSTRASSPSRWRAR